MDQYWRLLADCIVGGASYNTFLLATGALRLPDVKLLGPNRQRSLRPLQKVMGCSRSLSEWLYAQLDVLVNSHALRPLRQLGEGGFAFVYLVKELPGPGAPNVDTGARYALKKVLASTPEQLQAAQREIEAHQAASHPCLLPLLDWSVVPPPPSNPAGPHTVYMLSPAYTDGSLADLLIRLGKARASNNPHQFGKATVTEAHVYHNPQLQQCLLSTKQVLGLFAQLCLALASLHNAGYAHRDVKTHNVLVRRLDDDGQPLVGSGASVPNSREGSAHGAARYLSACAPRFSAPAVGPHTNPYQLAPAQQQPSQQQQHAVQPAALATALASLPGAAAAPSAWVGGLVRAQTCAASQLPPETTITNAADAARLHGGYTRPSHSSHDGTLRGAERLRGLSPRTSLAGPTLLSPACGAATAAASPSLPSLSPVLAGAAKLASPPADEQHLCTALLLDASDWAEQALASVAGDPAKGGGSSAGPAAGAGQGQAQPAAALAPTSPLLSRLGPGGSAGSRRNPPGAGEAAGAGELPSSPSLQVLVQVAVSGEEHHPDQAAVLQLRRRATYEAVLMDFGSACARLAEVPTRAHAMRLQEDAEANCTATFRAPELWDVPGTPCVLDQAAADVWSAGCTLFALMYGLSPFQLCLNQGGSLTLAVMNVSVPWPKEANCCYPQELHELVMSCLAMDPAMRPAAAALALEAQALMWRSPALPDPALYVTHPPYPPEVHG